MGVILPRTKHARSRAELGSVVNDNSLWSILAGGRNGVWVKVVKTSLGGEDTSNYLEG